MKNFIIMSSLLCNIYFYAINIRMSDEFLMANADLEKSLSEIHSNFKTIEGKAIEVAKENNLLFINNQDLIAKNNELLAKAVELSKVNIEINSTLQKEKDKPLINKAMEVGKEKWNYIVTDIKSNLSQNSLIK